MVLTNDSTLVSRLIASWNARGEELRERLETDPTNNASWLWAIQLRICTYLVRRYGREHKSDSNRIVKTERSDSARRSPSAIYAMKQAHPYDECEHRAQFRHRCHETLVRLKSLVADARSRSLKIADSQVKFTLERRCPSRRRRPGLRATVKAVAVVVILLFVLSAILKISFMLRFPG